MLGEFVQSASSPNIFSRQFFMLPGGGKPLPYAFRYEGDRLAEAALNGNPLKRKSEGSNELSSLFVLRDVGDAVPYDHSMPRTL